MLERIISSFIVLTNIRQIFVGIDSSGFKATHASQYYAERAKLKRRRTKYIKVSLGADVLKQIICIVKIRRTPARHDNIYRFPTTYNKGIRNPPIICSYS
jgi:hypothetical protein